MKKIVSLMLMLVLACSMLVVAAFADEGTPTVVISPSADSVNIGETITVNFTVENAENLAGVGFKIALTGFEIESVSYPNSDEFVMCTFQKKSSKFVASGDDGNNDSTMVVLTMVLKATALGEQTVSVTDVETSDVNQKYTPSISPATITVTHEHVIEAVAAVPADCSKNQNGTAAHYKCTVEGCGKLFSDAEGKTEVTAENLVVEYKHQLQAVIQDNEYHTIACGVKDCEYVVGTEKHTVTNNAPTCTEQGKCDVCFGNIDALGHDWADAWTESEDGTGHYHVCKNGCGDTTTTYAAHTGGTATCVAKAVCSTCGGEYGELAKHVLSGDTYEHENGQHWKACTVEGCDYTTEKTACSGGTATCVAKAECSTCGGEYGELAKHTLSETYKNENDQHWQECTVEGCNYTTEKTACSGGTATCVAKAVCSACEKEYGDKNADNHVGNTVTDYDATQHWTECDACGADANDKIAHSLSWKSDGEQHWQECSGCDYATAKENCSDENGTAATCEKDAVCGTCKKDIANTALGHNYTGNDPQYADLADAGDCQTKATYYYYCINGNCDASTKDDPDVAAADKTFEGDYGAHKGEAVAKKPATCVASGTEAHYKCTVEGCGKLFNDEACTQETTLAALEIAVDNTAHKGQKVEKINATCKATGTAEHYKCTVEGCGKLFNDEACTDATDLEALTLAIDTSVDGHDLKANPGTPATCMKDGVKAHWTCSRCDVLYAFTENVAGGVGEQITEGNKDELYVETLDPDAHHWVWGKNETGHWEYCDYCYELCEDGVGPGDDNHPNTTPAPHVFGDWVTANGYKTKTCECGYYISEKVETTGTGTGSNVPATGDDTPIALWALVFLCSGAAAVALGLKKKEN